MGKTIPVLTFTGLIGKIIKYELVRLPQLNGYNKPLLRASCVFDSRRGCHTCGEQVAHRRFFFSVDFCARVCSGYLFCSASPTKQLQELLAAVLFCLKIKHFSKIYRCMNIFIEIWRKKQTFNLNYVNIKKGLNTSEFFHYM